MVMIGIVLLALRELRARKYCGKPVGLCLSRAIIVCSLVMLLLRANAVPFFLSTYHPVRYDSPSHLAESRLEKTAERHLVLVRYPSGTLDSEGLLGWVHNYAEIDRPKIVWAWDMRDEKNRELVEYFRGRQVSLVNSRDKPPELTPYPPILAVNFRVSLAIDARGNGR
jgi:hypothetical protein